MIQKIFDRKNLCTDCEALMEVRPTYPIIGQPLFSPIFLFSNQENGEMKAKTLNFL
jgi:hypothetical protein